MTPRSRCSRRITALPIAAVLALLTSAPACSGGTCAAACAPPTATFALTTPLVGTVFTLTGHYVGTTTYLTTICGPGDGSFSCTPMHSIFDAEGVVGMFDPAARLLSVVWDNPNAGDLHLHVDLDGHEGLDRTFTYARTAGGGRVCGQECIASATFTAN
jgi:hypothetical protein